jgi:hypothetical protein
MRVGAIAMTLILLSVIVVCPMAACPFGANPVPAPDSCCHKPKSHSTPCHSEAVPDCPYLILDKSKTNTDSAHAVCARIIVATAQLTAPPSFSHLVDTEWRLVNSAGLFLRNCVLLI